MTRDRFEAVTWRVRENVPAILAAWFARRVGRDSVNVRSFERPTDNGMSSLVYLIDLEWVDGATQKVERFVVRQEPSEDPLFYEADIARWARAQQIVADRHGLPVPKVYFIEDDPAVLGSRFFAMKRIAGRIPPDRPPYRASGWVTELGSDERAGLWHSAVEALAAIHRIDWRAAGLDSIRRGSGDTEITAEVDHWVAHCDWAYGRRTELVDRTAAWLKRNAPSREQLCLCWGDVRPSNMVFGDGRLVGALDWELVSIGDPAKDLAWWNFSEFMFDRALGLPALDGCLSGRALLEAYEAASGAKLENYEYYEIFNVLRAVAIVARNAAIVSKQGVTLPPRESAEDNTATRALEELLVAAGEVP